MLTFSRIRSIFFTEASQRSVFQIRKTKFPGGIQGNLHAAGGKSRSHRIEKTSGKRLRFSGFASVRWRDESVALPDTLHRRERARRLIDKVESQSRHSSEGTMAKKPTVDEARLILELYDLRREPELRKARQWWLTTFWPKDADEFMKVAMDFGSQENNWLRQVGSYWGIATSFVLNGVVSEKLFFEPAFCGELYFMFAKVRPFLKELREKAKNPDLFLMSEKAILGSKLGRAQFAKVEPRVAMMRQQR